MEQQNNKKGFTLVETLVTVIIVLLLSLILTELTSLASRYFTSTVKDADGQMLCSTLTNALEDELRFATNIDYDSDSNTFKYFSKKSGLGRESQIVTKNVDGKNILYITNAYGDEYPLINVGSYVYDLGAYTNMTYDVAKNIVYITLDIKDSTNRTICSNTFTVKPLNPGNLN